MRTPQATPKHPLAIRWFHWISVPLFFAMIWSGLLIYWANAVYRISLGGFTLLPLFPDWFFNGLGIPYRLAEGMSLHFFFMWFFAINGLLYVLYTMLSGEWRYLVPNRRSFVEAIQVVLHDLGVSPVEPPSRKFNGAQQIAYTTIVLMGAGSLLTGLAIYKPVQVGWLTTVLGGYEWARWEHFWLTIGYLVFVVIHVVQVTRAGWHNFRGMVTGYEYSEPGYGQARRSFLALGFGAVATVVGWKWLTTRPEVDGVPYPLRRTLEFNGTLAERYFAGTRLSPTYPRQLAREPRVNGGEGLANPIDVSAWRLQVVGGGDPLEVTLDEIKRLPRVEMTVDLKCIEGWSVIVNWAGCRLSDFAAAYRRAGVRYVGLATPDEGYYVSLDMDSALHPQTLLCYEMNGSPLTIEHGAPLRLFTPVKYGIKSIKRIGRISFSDDRPPDFWAERGYDWYAGL
jgi:thiosulfate reductase cytochrome b subunit